MPDLLLELFCEEIPARMQAQASEDLRRLVTDALLERGLTFAGAAAFATPRRLALHVADLPPAQPDRCEERKGPKVGAPEAAVAGFLKSAGLASIEDAKVQSDPKKGDFYVAIIERRGQPTLDVLAALLPTVIESFPWPKSMRWGPASVSSSSLRWVRPLHSIVATFGPETEEPDVVPFAIGGIQAGNTTFGHRFMAPAPISVRRFDDYVPALQAAKVVLDPARRRDIILHDARNLALAQGLDLVEDDALLAEVAGLVEWPVVLMSEFEESFLAIPPEVIRGHDPRQPEVLRAAPRRDGPARPPLHPRRQHRGLRRRDDELAAGNRQGRARSPRRRAILLGESDLKVPLADRLPKLDAVVYHQKLGTQGERVQRLKRLAADYAGLVGGDPAEARAVPPNSARPIS